MHTTSCLGIDCDRVFHVSMCSARRLVAYYISFCTSLKAFCWPDEYLHICIALSVSRLNCVHVNWA